MTEDPELKLIHRARRALECVWRIDAGYDPVLDGEEVPGSPDRLTIAGREQPRCISKPKNPPRELLPKNPYGLPHETWQDYITLISCRKWWEPKTRHVKPMVLQGWTLTKQQQKHYDAVLGEIGRRLARKHQYSQGKRRKPGTHAHRPRLSEEIMAKARDEAKRRGVSVSVVIQEWCEIALQKGA